MKILLTSLLSLYSSYSLSTESIYCSNLTAGVGFEAQFSIISGLYSDSKLNIKNTVYGVTQRWGKMDLDNRVIYVIGSTDHGDIVFVADHLKGVVSAHGVQHDLECDWSALGEK